MDYRCPRAITGSVTSGLSICLCQLHDTWIALILCASRNGRGQRVKRLTLPWTFPRLENCIHYVPRIVEDSKKGSNVTDSIKESEQFEFLRRGIAFLGGNNDCNSQNLVYGNSRKEDFEKLWRDHIRLFGVEKINAITAATLLTQPQYDTRASLSTWSTKTEFVTVHRPVGTSVQRYFTRKRVRDWRFKREQHN